MSTDLAIIQKKDIETSEKLGIDIDVYRALKNSLFPEANDISIGMYLAYCRAKGYDPLKKPMHIVPIGCKTGRKDDGGKDIYETRDVIMPGINSYRIDAMRTGNFYGISDAEFGPMITRKFGKNNVEVSFPEWCRIVIYKKIGDQIREIPAKLYWIECYSSVSAFSDEPNRMWKKRPRAMLEKCSESLAYRKGFPEEIGAIPTHEEMEGKSTMDEIPGEKDITEESKNLDKTPLSVSFKIDSVLLEKHLDAINNCTTMDQLRDAYAASKLEISGDKDASNKIVDAKNARKDYIKQIEDMIHKAKSSDKQSNDEWLAGYNGEKKDA